jgi:hypothetical protein
MTQALLQRASWKAYLIRKESMEMYKLFRIRPQHNAINLAVVVLVIFVASFASAAAQSTDRDRPTKLTSNEIKGGPVDDTVEYYYSLAAGPGELTVTVDAKANKNAAAPGIFVELFDSKARRLLNISAIVGLGDSKRDIKSVKLGSRQPVVMQLKLERGLEQYLVRIEGALQLGKPEQTAGASQSSRSKMRIEMNDGSIQEIDLSRVRRITVEP